MLTLVEESRRRMLYFSVDTFFKGLLNYVGGYVKPACFSNYFLEIMCTFGVAALQ